MKTITIRVSDELEADLKKIAEHLGSSQSEIVREALKSHLKIQKFRAVRKLVMPYAEKQGYLTDEDIYSDPDIS